MTQPPMSGAADEASASVTKLKIENFQLPIFN
jgi:hypothetical protein